MNEIIQLDKELLLYLNGLGSIAFDHFWLLITGKWFWIPLYVIFLYFLAKKFPIKSLLYILIFITLGIIISDQLSGIFKHEVMRLRPCHNPELIHKMRLVTCGGSYGFYSSHASNSFFIATFLSLLLKEKLKWFPWLIFSWAILVSYSRVYLGVHFPGDIVVGIIAGILLGCIFYLIILKILNKKD